MCRILLLLAALFCSINGRKKRPLIIARESERVPDTYFVHFRKHARLDQLQEVVRELNERSSQSETFKANVASIVTRAGFGFSAKLSSDALNYVSVLHGHLYITLCKYLHDKLNAVTISVNVVAAPLKTLFHI